MADQFLGSALAFPIRPNGLGGLTTVQDIEAVEDSMRAILETLKGAHTYNPFLGLESFVFQPVPDLALIEFRCRVALIYGDDRLDSVDVQGELGDDGLLTLIIEYSIKGEADSRTLQFPFRTLNG